ncbi:MAG: DUF2490 domain-containing protein [Candidatus Omnitrophica bacterium]|nr:DUF2490 domain-containing protein [Candidatus Omnitrophota bacterium]
MLRFPLGWTLPITVVFCLMAILASPIGAQEKGELWSKQSFTISLPELEQLGATDLKFEVDNRWLDRYSNHYRTHFQGTLVFPIPGWEGWSLEPGYRRQITDRPNTDRVYIDRYLLHLNNKREDLFGTGWDFSFRNRWEILDPEGVSDQVWRTRFRGKLSKGIPGFKTADRAWKFWVFDEVFYNFETDRLGQNRLASGIDIPLSQQATLSLGYQWEAVDTGPLGDGWEDNHMILLNFSFNFENRRELDD